MLLEDESNEQGWKVNGPASRRVVSWLRATVLCCTMAGTLVGCGLGDGGPLALDEVGADCVPGEFAASADYLGDVASVRRLSTSVLSDAVATGDVADALIAHGEVVIESEDLAGLPSVVANPADVSELRRLPSDLSVLAGVRRIESPSPGGLVVFVAIELDDGHLHFAGNCARVIHESTIASYARVGGVSPSDVLLSIVSDQACLEDYQRFEEWQGTDADFDFNCHG